MSTGEKGTAKTTPKASREDAKGAKAREEKLRQRQRQEGQDGRLDGGRIVEPGAVLLRGRADALLGVN